MHDRSTAARPLPLVPLLAAGLALLIACGGPGPASTGATAGPATPVGTIAPSTDAPGSESASPGGAGADAGAALDAFRAFVQTDQSFHLAGDLLMTVGDLTLQAAITSDVSRGDEQGIIDLRGPGVSIRVSAVIVDGQVYVRLANRPWEAVDTEVGFANPLSGLHVEGLQPVDIVNVNGVQTHHFRAENPEGLDGQTLSGNTLTDLTVQSSSLDVYVTPDGVPVTAIAEFAGRGTFGEEEGPVTLRIRYDFSKFGQELEIVAPT